MLQGGIRAYFYLLQIPSQSADKALMPIETAMEATTSYHDLVQTKHSPMVYLVDDDEAVPDSLALVIVNAGFSVNTYRSSAAFLKHYDPAFPGCLVLDVRMPDMDGLELQQYLIEHGIAIPIIFISTC